MRAACLVVVAAIGLLAAAGITEVAARRFNPIHEGAQRYRAHQQMRADQGLPDEYQQNPSGGDYSYYTVWTKYTLDHFNFRSSVSEGGENSFPARYLVNDNSFQKPTPTQPECGPIFFYTGNEGPVDAFANATGFMFDLAPKFNALLIFAEHRSVTTRHQRILHVERRRCSSLCLLLWPATTASRCHSVRTRSLRRTSSISRPSRPCPTTSSSSRRSRRPTDARSTHR
jgi:hypothetical protein